MSYTCTQVHIQVPGCLYSQPSIDSVRLVFASVNEKIHLIKILLIFYNEIHIFSINR